MNMTKNYLNMQIEEKLQLLGRMKSDCEYYLGEGRKQITHLWGSTVDNQIRSMQELLSSISKEYRPEWLTFDDIRKFSDQMDHRQVITAETLGLSGARFITFEPGSQQEPRRKDEIFFTIKKRAYTEKDGKKTFHVTHGEQGYITMTNGMEKIFNTLFRDRPNNRSMECIEWDDSWNIVFEDGICISSHSCRMEKSEFAEWYRTIKPAT